MELAAGPIVNLLAFGSEMPSMTGARLLRVEDLRLFTTFHLADEGSPKRQQMRKKFSFDNVWSHSEEAVKEPQRPKRADKELRPRAKSEPHSS